MYVELIDNFLHAVLFYFLNVILVDGALIVRSTLTYRHNATLFYDVQKKQCVLYIL